MKCQTAADTFWTDADISEWQKHIMGLLILNKSVETGIQGGAASAIS